MSLAIATAIIAICNALLCPEADRFVVAAGGNGLAVWTEGDVPELIGVALEGVDFLGGGEVPGFHGLVVACGGQGFAVRAVGQAADPAGVALEFARVLQDDLLIGAVYRPEADGLIVAAAGQRFAIRVEGNGKYLATVTKLASNLLTAFQTP